MAENVILLMSFYLELGIFSAESPIVGRDFVQNTQRPASSKPSTSFRARRCLTETNQRQKENGVQRLVARRSTRST
jgi:hypothetical protein